MSIGDEYHRAIEWCASQNLFYLKADILIPKEVYSEVLEIYNLGLFTNHRINDGKGWSSATLHGDDWNITGYNPDKSNYHWTSLCEKAPIMTNWIKNVFPNNGLYGRCRFMLLEPGGFIRKHTDTHKWKPGMPLANNVTRAINICITQPENCYLRNAETLEEVPFKPREVYWFNNGFHHEAANFSKEPRFHFIIHGATNDERRQLFINSVKKEYPHANF